MRRLPARKTLQNREKDNFQNELSKTCLLFLPFLNSKILVKITFRQVKECNLAKGDGNLVSSLLRRLLARKTLQNSEKDN